MHPQPAQALGAEPRRPDARTRVPSDRNGSTEGLPPRPHPRHAVAPEPPINRRPASWVVGTAVLATAAAVAFDVALTGRLSMFFDLCFILVGLCAALVVRREGLYAVGVLPPLLLAAVMAVLAVGLPAALTDSRLAFASTWLTGLAHHGGALGSAHAVVLAIVGLRATQEPRRATAPRTDSR